MRTFLECIPLQSFQYKTFHEVAMDLNIKCYTPTSPCRQYRAAFGEVMHIWFDRSEYWNTLGRDDTFEDQLGINESVEKASYILNLHLSYSLIKENLDNTFNESA